MSLPFATAAVSKPERGKQFWTVKNLTSAPFLLTVATVALCVLGLVMVFSASSIEAVEKGATAWGDFTSQLLFVGVSLIPCAIVLGVGGSFWVDKAFYVLWGVVLVMLVAVLAVGTDSHGATRWIGIGGFSLQPSEFAKIVLVMAAARILADWERRRIGWKKTLALLAVFVALPFGLILAQKDLGTLLIVGFTIFLMAVLARVRPIVLAIIAVVCVVAVIVLISMASYRSSRFSIWLDPYSDYYGEGWQPIHGLYAFASGGFFGLGLGNSRQKYSYLPEAENDFIYAIIGEELGFLGAFFVIALFALWGWSGMRIAYAVRGRDRVSSLMVSGLTIIVEVQALLNIGGVLGVLPLSGRPLPFISAGGSSALASLIIVGLILGVARENEAAVEEQARSLRASRRHLTVLDGGTPPSDGRPRVQEASSGRAEGPAAGAGEGRPEAAPARRTPGAGEPAGVAAGREPGAGRIPRRIRETNEEGRMR